MVVRTFNQGFVGVVWWCGGGGVAGIFVHKIYIILCFRVREVCVFVVGMGD